jgi:hypothetical protein
VFGDGSALESPGLSAPFGSGHGHEEVHPVGCLGVEDLEGVGGGETFGGQFLDTFVASNPYSTGLANTNALATAFLCAPSASAADIDFAAAYHPVPWHIDHTGTAYSFDGGFATLGLAPESLSGLHSVPQTWLDFQQALLDTGQGTRPDIDLDFLPGWNDEAANRTQAAGNFGSLGGSPLSNELAPISWPTPEFTPTETSSPATWWSDNGPTTVALGSSEPNTFVWYSCRECPKTWATKDGLNRHVKNCHEKKLRCPRPGCKMRFGPRAELKRHLNTVRHGGTRDFVCPQCGKKLSRKDFLRRHLRQVHRMDLPKGRGGNLGPAIMGG